MRTDNRPFGLLLAATLVLGFSGALLLAPADASGQTRRSRLRERPLFPTSDPWGTDDLGWTLMQMQRESIAAQEEQAREAGRQQRRAELERQQEQEAAARGEYFDSLIEASRAALRAPQGVYYRKPGFVSVDPPSAGAAPVSVGGIPYLFDRGVFLLAQGAQYVAVTAPVGAVVAALPAGAYPVPSGAGVLHYYFGTFYRAREVNFEVVVPPPGTMVSYLPDGYEVESAGGATRYRFGPTTFKPLFVQGVLVYQVVAP